MAQSGKPKLSSNAKRLLDEAQTDPSSLVTAGLAYDDDRIDQAWLAWTYEDRKLLLHDLANLRDESALPRFWRRKKVGGYAEPIIDIMQLRDELREVWTAGNRSLYAETVLNKWLRWQPSDEQVQNLQKYDVVPADFIPFACSVRSRRLVPNYLSLRSMLIQGVFEHWGHLKKCANRDCATPYFIAKRKDQTVCDAEACKAEKQREHALKWWKQNRAKKASKKQKRSRRGAN